VSVAIESKPLTANASTMASYPSQWPINADILDMLVRVNWLRRSLNDHIAIGAAIARVLAGVE
jgi:hypothetical protein